MLFRRYSGDPKNKKQTKKVAFKYRQGHAARQMGRGSPWRATHGTLPNIILIAEFPSHLSTKGSNQR